jgi:hypothetical protein
MTRTTPKAAVLALAAAFAVLPAAMGPADALPRAVTAHSNYGNGSVTGAVRINPQGYPEVQLPSGTWIDCEGDCRDALRRMQLDFWETLREDSDGDRQD